MDEADDLLEIGDVFVFPDAKITGGDAAFREDGRCLDHNESGATLGARAEMNEMPVGGEAVLRRVLAHGRDAYAICKVDRAKRKERKERMTHG
jgi:hypothetical protein